MQSAFEQRVEESMRQARTERREAEREMPGVFSFADPASQQFRARAALAERAGARRAKARSRDTEAAEDRERRNYSRVAVRKKKRVAVRRWTKDPPARK
jgi:hypothetical protein